MALQVDKGNGEAKDGKTIDGSINFSDILFLSYRWAIYNPHICVPYSVYWRFVSQRRNGAEIRRAEKIYYF